MCNIRDHKRIYRRAIRQAKSNWWKSFFVDNLNKEPFGVFRNLNYSELCVPEIVEISANGASFREPNDIATTLG